MKSYGLVNKPQLFVVARSSLYFVFVEKRLWKLVVSFPKEDDDSASDEFVQWLKSKFSKGVVPNAANDNKVEDCQNKY